MKNSIKKIGMMTFLFFMTLFLFLTGCDKESSPTGPVIYTVDGSWSGNTSQSQNVSFTVASSEVTYFKIKIIAVGFTQESQVWPSNCMITSNSFSLSVSGNPTLTITGEFTSNTSATGTFKLGTTTGTWTASR